MPETEDNPRRMTFLPVVERELRVAARRRATSLVRGAAAGVGLGMTAWILLADESSPQKAGSDLFVILAVLTFIYAGIFGTQVTADCLSEEKREGTLGLLFLTDLKGYDVVLGKLAATSLHWFYGMLAVVPVLAIPLMLGGVSQAELLRVVLVSVNLLFFSLSIGLWASSLCRRDSRAHGLSFFVALAILFTLPAVIQAVNPSIRNLRGANLSSPAYGCALAFDNASQLNRHFDFWLNAIITQFYSWTFLGFACWIAPRSWQDAVQRRTPFGQPSPRLAEDQCKQRTKLLALNPFLWRVSRGKFNGFAVWLMLAVVAALWLWAHFAFLGYRGKNSYYAPLDIVFLWWGGLMVKIW